MSLPFPTTTAAPLVTSAGAAPSASGPFSSAAATTSLEPSVVLTPAEMTSALRDLAQAVQGIRTFLAASYGPQPPGAIATASPSHLPPWQPPPASHVSPPDISNQASSTAQGVPITQVRFPPSPSLLPD